MFHVAGVTPEAELMDHSITETLPLGRERVAGALSSLGSSEAPLGAVSVGTPHASVNELETLARHCVGLKTSVPFYVNAGRDVLGRAGDAVEVLERFGATIVTDTCTYITPILGDVRGAVMTNSGKWAYYAPANLGVDVVMGTLADCVESAASGRTIVRGVPT